ncbi:MAG: hypothetical protein HRT36_06725 [Alphaproteobacteria bacterium]|nr:hypothetical protein [Alphaproteobacteria bacterium]
MLIRPGPFPSHGTLRTVICTGITESENNIESSTNRSAFSGAAVLPTVYAEVGDGHGPRLRFSALLLSQFSVAE